MSNVKGSVLLSRLDFVREQFGEEGLARLLDALSEEDRRVTTKLLPAQWYTFDLGERIDSAVMNVLGKGAADTFLRLGFQSADVNLAGVHSVFVHAGDPHGLLRRAPAIYQLYYDTGHRTYEQTGENSCRLTTFDSEGFSEADCYTVIGWHQRAVEICGGENVEVDHVRCRARGDAVCQYEISWTLPVPRARA
ncbi:MAG: TIGR02265 family protein [Acidobacteriota bacterium]